MSEDDQMKAGNSLCISCGFCCDGTLFSHVPIRNADDLPTLEAAAFEIFLCGEQRRFNQPCVAHSSLGCEIYIGRPINCRKFRCKLLTEFFERRISLHSAQEKINQAISLRKNLLDALQRIDPSLPGVALTTLWGQWDRRAKDDDGLSFRRKHGAALMQMAALRWYLWEHFHG